MGDDVITIFFDANVKAFKKGTQAVKTAVESLNRTTKQFTNRAIGSFKRLIPLVAGVGSVFGILSKGVSTYLSQHEELGKKMNAVWTTIGNLIGPIIERIINLIATATSYFVGFMNALGITSKKASELSKSTGTLQKTLAGFDELNVLQDNGGGSLDDKELPELMGQLAEFLKNKMWDEAADLIIKKMNDLIYLFRDKAEEFGIKCSDYLQGALHIIARVLNEVDWKQLGVGIANFFNGLLRDIEGINLGEDIGKILVAQFTIAFKVLTGFLEQIDAARMGQIFSGIITGAIDAITTAIQGADFKKIGEQIRLFFESIDWEEIKNKVIELFKTMWDGAVEFLWGLIAGDSKEEPPTIGALKNIGDAIAGFADTLSEILGGVWTDIKEAVEFIMQSETVANVIDTIAGAIDAVGKFCAEHKEAIISIIEGVGVALGTYGIISSMEKIISLIGTFLAGNWVVLIIAAIGALIGYLVNLYNTNEEFREKVNAAWDAVKTAIGTVVDWITEKWEKLKEAYNTLKQKFEENGIAAIWDTIKGGIGTAIDGMKTKFTELKEGLAQVKDKFGELKDKASEKWEKLKEKLHVDELKEKFVKGFTELKDKALEKFETMKSNLVKTSTKLDDEISKAFANMTKKAEEFKKKYEELSKELKEKNNQMSKSVEEDFNRISELVEAAAVKCSQQMDKSWADIATKVSAGVTKVTTAASKMKDSLVTVCGAVAEASNKSFTALSENIARHMEAALNKVTTANQSMKSDSERQWQSIKSSVSNITTAISNDVKNKYSSMSSEVQRSMTALSNNVVNSFEQMGQRAVQSINSMVNSIGNSLSGLAREVTYAINDMSWALRDGLSELSYDAYYWGQDMMDSYADGINSRSYTVSNAVSGAAMGVKKFLGFSEPEEGPLSDFHTYGPDMMELYSSTILKSSSKVYGAVEKVAKGMADRLSGAELSVGTNLSALEGIGQNIQWKMPAVAGGGFLPYNVSATTGSNVETNASVADALARLNETIDGLQNAIENMEWVAQFGNVRAVVREINKVQRQIERAEG